MAYPGTTDHLGGIPPELKNFGSVETLCPWHCFVEDWSLGLHVQARYVHHIVDFQGYPADDEARPRLGVEIAGFEIQNKNLSLLDSLQPDLHVQDM